MHVSINRVLLTLYSLLVVLSARAEFPVPNEYARSEVSGYRAYYTSIPVEIDGLDTDAAWDSVAWTFPFIDIRGEPIDSTIWDDLPVPRYETRAKMAWDSTYFYIYAWLEEPHLWATYDQHDMVIYHENDFEVFIDPDGDNHNYYELEINALGTTWDLLLTRPYRDGGHAVDSWEIPGLKKAVHLKGTLNDPSDIDEGWAVELALPWRVLEECASHPGPPTSGQWWRVNFSRVQWQLDVVDGKYVKRTDPETGNPLPEDNWVWSPQGLIAMHYPEQWGWVSFETRFRGTIPSWYFPPDEIESQRELMRVYYAQRQFKDENGRWAGSFAELAIDSTQLCRATNVSAEMDATLYGFQARLVRNMDWEHMTWRAYTIVDQTGRIWKDSYKDPE